MNLDDTKQLRVDRSLYKLNVQIQSRNELSGTIQGELEEDAVIDELDGTSTSTGAYLEIARLDSRLPSVIPMHGSRSTSNTLVLQSTAKTTLSTTREKCIVINQNGLTM
jgi:hypothetical protein